MENEFNDASQISRVRTAKPNTEEEKKYRQTAQEEAMRYINKADSFVVICAGENEEKISGEVTVISMVRATSEGPSAEARAIVDAFKDWVKKYKISLEIKKEEGRNG